MESKKTIKLTKKIIYKGVIEVITGLHIGGTNLAMNIGGIDSAVVRNPLDNIPYIPGSSLKGKLRSLIEIKNGESEEGEPSNDPKSKAGMLFGVKGDRESSRPSRLIVRDATLDLSNLEKFKDYEDLPYTESKTEVTINRVTAKANPRTFERVPAGSKFNFEMILNIFEGEDEEELKNILNEAISLLHVDYLGGQGSRGYGQVKVNFDNENGDVLTYN